MHRALLHDFVHRAEHEAFVDDLGEDAIIHAVKIQCVHEGLLEDFIGDWCCRVGEIFELRLVIFSHRELVDQGENHCTTSTACILAEGHNHAILQLLRFHVERLADLVHSLAILGRLVDNVGPFPVNQLREYAGRLDGQVDY